MNINDTSTQLLYSTVPITCNFDNGVVTGTGFFFSRNLDDGSSVPFLITNYHVVENAKAGYFEVTLADGQEPGNKSIRVNFNGNELIGKKLGSLDLAAIPIAPVMSALGKAGTPPFYRSISDSLVPDEKTVDELTALEEVTFIGYPKGIFDRRNKIPLIRRGSTATPIWNRYLGDRAFLVDASVFPGSSGSPVFLFNQGSYPANGGVIIGSRLLFVGIVASSFVLEGTEYLDLGYVIRSDAMLEEIDTLISRLLGKGGKK